MGYPDGGYGPFLPGSVSRLAYPICAGCCGVPAEIPEDVGAFKSQQFRWAKGSIQTALKLLPRIFASNASNFKKVEAFFHLTHYLVHPLMVIMAVLALPVLMMLEFLPSPVVFTALALLLALAMAAPSTLCLVSQRASHEKDWGRRVVYLPFSGGGGDRHCPFQYARCTGSACGP